MNNITLTIATKNKLDELKITLESLKEIILAKKVDCIICDDGSTDDSIIEYLRENYPMILVLKNRKSRGIHFTRNLMFSKVKTPYALCLDDDVSLLTCNSLGLIENYFDKNPKCSVIAFRIFWSKKQPITMICNEDNERVKSFGAGACAWRMSYWRMIPNFLDWFMFYGEEDFAAFHLYKKGLEIHYVPDILVHHRVDVKSRKMESDYKLRLRRSLRSGWYLYLLFYPLKLIPRKFSYTLWMQLKLKVFKGDMKALVAIFLALFDVFLNLPRLLKNSNRLSSYEFEQYQKLTNSKLYWIPK
ncbi:glycosyltransferase family 2 protein [Lutibacter sp. HS1-25]|uniref:glycosyltransferase family 2 protein n=1 Tax=Lutibacter sp. HS1-25 TaxID=2485000 RepID=UPI001010869B|nr:glycosyltransferase family A protein [Lutibacter sp. HS1-25]RXP52569.1 glycosyltransferase family 2 protein [Lutibacter sp. HS1-25]